MKCQAIVTHLAPTTHCQAFSSGQKPCLYHQPLPATARLPLVGAMPPTCPPGGATSLLHTPSSAPLPADPRHLLLVSPGKGNALTSPSPRTRLPLPIATRFSLDTQGKARLRLLSRRGACPCLHRRPPPASSPSPPYVHICAITYGKKRETSGTFQLNTVVL